MYNAMLLKTTASSYLKYRVWTLQSAKNLTAASFSYNGTLATGASTQIGFNADLVKARARKRS